MISLQDILIWNHICIHDGLDAADRWMHAKEMRLTTYPRMFKLMRDRSDRVTDRLGHVATGVLWQDSGPVTLYWPHPHPGNITHFPTLGALKKVHGHYDAVRGVFNTRVVFTPEPEPVSVRLSEAVDDLYYVLSDYIGSVEKKAHVGREELKKAFGKVQDLMVEGAPAGMHYVSPMTNTADTAECA